MQKQMRPSSASGRLVDKPIVRHANHDPTAVALSNTQSNKYMSGMMSKLFGQEDTSTSNIMNTASLASRMAKPQAGHGSNINQLLQSISLSKNHILQGSTNGRQHVLGGRLIEHNSPTKTTTGYATSYWPTQKLNHLEKRNIAHSQRDIEFREQMMGMKQSFSNFLMKRKLQSYI